MPQRLTAHWYAEHPRPSLLQPLSWLYGGLLALRTRGYAAGWLRSERAGRPVVVVGNLTVGGTGKTPLTLWLAGELQARGVKVGILSRGYKRRGKAARVVLPDADWHEVGDEPLLLARRSGAATVVARDRVAGARLLAAAGVELILCDDGLQHLRLARDCEIVVIDGARGFGNGRLLPAGPLREPTGRLAGADLVVVNGAPAHASLADVGAALPPLRMDLIATDAVRLDAQESRPLAAFRGQTVHAVAGIGNPQRFFGQLRAQGIELTEHAFADHYPLTARDLAFADERVVLMTEKDAVKCAAFADARLWSVPVVARFSDADAQLLLACVLATTDGRSAAGSQI
jgi:tetraacyldisaccharide 4'-kinase